MTTLNFILHVTIVTSLHRLHALAVGNGACTKRYTHVHYLMEFSLNKVCENNYCKLIALFMCAIHWKTAIKVSLTNLNTLKKGKFKE